METRRRIYEPGLENYPKHGILLANLFVGLIFATGTILCAFLSPLLAGVYLAFIVVMVLIVPRRLTCPNCYYHSRWCAVGWGKLAAQFSGRGDLDKFGTDLAARSAPVTYGLLVLVPLICVTVSMVQEFEPPKVVALAVYLSLFGVVFFRKTACSRCKMRLVCRGCAAKIEDPAMID